MSRKNSKKAIRASTPYGNFIDEIARGIDVYFGQIGSYHNFEFGTEFEIAICTLLSRVLPTRFGVCRGYVVSCNGEQFGDDIIVYDKMNYPVLRLTDDLGFSIKQRIPAEAVCAYIEAKHTLFLEGASQQSIRKALSQVRAVKSIAREPVPWSMVDGYFQVDGNPDVPADWPCTRNQVFGAVFARKVVVRQRKDAPPVEDPATVQAALDRESQQAPHCDIVVAGPSIVGVPAIGIAYNTPFYVEGKSRLVARHVEARAVAVGIVSLLYCLDMMRLRAIGWQEIISNAMGLDVVDNRNLPSVQFKLPIYAICAEHPSKHIHYDEARSFVPIFSDLHSAEAYSRVNKAIRSKPLCISTKEELDRLIAGMYRQGISRYCLDSHSGALRERELFHASRIEVVY